MTATATSEPRFPVAAWKVIQPVFAPAETKRLEAVFALANGYMGQRAVHEFVPAPADSLRGFYVAGVFDTYLNQTMIKLKGRPSHPHQMVNLPDSLPVQVTLDGEVLDLTQAPPSAYARTLHLDRGTLTLEVTLRTPHGLEVRVACTRFLSLHRRHLAAMRIVLTPLSGDMNVGFTSLVDGSVTNLTQSHLIAVKPLTAGAGRKAAPGSGRLHGVTCRTAGTGVTVAVAAREFCSGAAIGSAGTRLTWKDGVSRQLFVTPCRRGESLTFDKFTAVATSRDHDVSGSLGLFCRKQLDAAMAAGFATLETEQAAAWAEIWRTVEIDIAESNGAGALTQGLHYSLFQMYQNAPNGDHTVNIGAKGLTGEHYSGTYFWDTEVFMLPMFAFTRPQTARDLVQSRVHYLPGARRKATEFSLQGAAYPFMSDENGDEAATLWQFGLLGVHVSADVAWSMWFYYCVTGDLEFMAHGGIDVLVETSRFWLSRVYFRTDTGEYVINRVLGPDEYHQGVDNNFYTNLMAQENLLKTVALLELLQRERPADYAAAVQRLHLQPAEVARCREVAAKMRLPRDAKRGLNLQDERFECLEPYDLKANPPGGALPAVWSYDRIMRTQLLRQADIVVAHVLLGDRFTPEDVRHDFDYYEPKTTHDSSLSFCSYSMAAAALRKSELALDYFLRTARLDLDDIHGNVWMGVHTACLAGAWQCVVLGFGGVRWFEGKLSLAPLLPNGWDSFGFSVAWHGARLHVKVLPTAVELQTDGPEVALRLGQRAVTAGPQVQRFTFPARPVRGVIFDLDGVLVETAEFHYQAWQKLADRIVVPFDRQRNEALRGVDRTNSLRLLLGEHAGRFSDVEKEAFCSEKNAVYVKLIEDITPKDLLPGAEKLLLALREAAIPAAVASSSKNARPVLERLGITSLLTAIVDGSEVAAAKPAPDLFLLAAAKLGLTPAQCVVVEDAEAGVAAARAGGMACIGIGTPERVGDANRVVNSVADIAVPMLDAL
ncbi:MAG: beta-phosphoglucomutase [bacterium]